MKAIDVVSKSIFSWASLNQSYLLNVNGKELVRVSAEISHLTKIDPRPLYLEIAERLDGRVRREIDSRRPARFASDLARPQLVTEINSVDTDFPICLGIPLEDQLDIDAGVELLWRHPQDDLHSKLHCFDANAVFDKLLRVHAEVNYSPTARESAAKYLLVLINTDNAGVAVGWLKSLSDATRANVLNCCVLHAMAQPSGSVLASCCEIISQLGELGPFSKFVRRWALSVWNDQVARNIAGPLVSASLLMFGKNCVAVKWDKLRLRAAAHPAVLSLIDQEIEHFRM